MKRTRLVRRTGLRPVSARRRALLPARRALVARLLAERPWCEIQWPGVCTGRAVDVDEIVARSAGGDFLDPAVCQTACRACHDAKHRSPAEAVRRGVTRFSWEQT